MSSSKGFPSGPYFVGFLDFRLGESGLGRVGDFLAGARPKENVVDEQVGPVGPPAQHHKGKIDPAVDVKIFNRPDQCFESWAFSAGSGLLHPKKISGRAESTWAKNLPDLLKRRSC